MIRGAAALLLAAFATGCVYLNTFYNAEQYFAEGGRLKAEAGDSLTAAAESAFERAAEKSGVVLERHPTSKYADDALLLLGHSLFEMERYSDASLSYQRFQRLFPDSDRLDEALLGWARSERMMGDYAAAGAVIAALIGDASPRDAAPDVLYERALVQLGSGDHTGAVTTFSDLIEGHQGYARDHEVALKFADAELAAGQYDAALVAYRAYLDGLFDPVVRRQVSIKVAKTLALAGQTDQALATYDDLISGEITDELAAVVQAERGDLLHAANRQGEAETAYLRVAELVPGTPVASRATLRRGRIVWLERGQRTEAMEILLDAFLHSPVSAYGDSARTESRKLSRILHYQVLAEGGEVVAGIDDPDLVQATAMYRFAEEVLETERDTAVAAALFRQLSKDFPDSPWRPRALLAAGLLADDTRLPGEIPEPLATLIAEYADHPAADAARSALDLDVPERPAGFYEEPEHLVELARVLPRAIDPMITIMDQLDRYRGRDRANRLDARDERLGGRRLGAVPGAIPGAAGQPQPGAEPPAAQDEPDQNLPGGRER